MIYKSSLAGLRRDITRSDLRFNLLRICGRAPRMIHHLIHAPTYPGIEKTLFSLQSEINVTIEIGECRNRELICTVDRVPDPWNRKMWTNLTRTTIAPFLLSPELCYAEPKTYEVYLHAWFALPQVKEELGEAGALTYALFLAFPEIAHRSFYAAAPRAELPDEPLDETGAKQLFGWYQLRDLPTEPTPQRLVRLLAGVRRPPLPAGFRLLREKKELRSLLAGFARILLSHKLRRPAPEIPQEFSVAELGGPELLAGRLRPVPFAELLSVVH